MKHLLLLILVIAVMPAFIGAEEPTATLETAYGEVFKGVVTLTEGKIKVVAGDVTQELDSKIVERIEWSKRLRSYSDPSNAIVITNDGDRFEGILLDAIGDDSLKISIPECGAVNLPFEELAGVIFIARQRNPDEEKRALVLFSGKTAKHDELRTRAGDIVQGIIVSVSSKEVVLDNAGKALTVAVDDISFLRFAPLAEQAKINFWHARVSTIYGNRITLRPDTITTTEICGQGKANAVLRIRIEDIRNVAFLGGVTMHLCEIAPVEVETKPFFIKSWPYKVNQSVKGTPLNVSGKRYEYGFGTHSYTRLAFNIEGDFELFKTAVGIDAEAGDLGSVEFRVICDGKQAYCSPIMKSGHIQGIELNIEGVKKLELVSDFGGDDDIGDLADWPDPRIIRKRPAQ